MLDLSDDLGTVFFGADFASAFLRVRAGAPSVSVTGILGVADDTALEGRALTAARVLRLPAGSDVRADDELQAQQAIAWQGVPAGARFIVLDHPRRVNDGAELDALLGSLQP